MFFFFFNDNNIEEHPMYKTAFNSIFIDKLYRDGYCDISFLVKNKFNKDYIKSKLMENNSPLYELYKHPYKVEVIYKYMPDILNKMVVRNYIRNEKDVWFDNFAIVNFVYKSISDSNGSLIFDMYKRWGNVFPIGYDIDIKDDIAYDSSKVEIIIVKSFEEYVKLFNRIIISDDEKLFYRGHSDSSYSLIPSLFRKKVWLNNEKKIYSELLSRCPLDFVGLESNIEKLAEMQHYGLPTRLLDITQNPLIALYFACESNEDSRGEVIIFDVRNDEINYMVTKQIEILSSLPLLSDDEKDKLYDFVKNKNKVSIKSISELFEHTFVNNVYLSYNISEQDLINTALYIPQKSIKRIENQDGAFFIHGLSDKEYSNKAGNVLDKYRYYYNNKKMICIVDNKSGILNKLDLFGINKAKVYPEIDDVAEYLKNHCEYI